MQRARCRTVQDSVSLWNATPSPGWQIFEVDALRLALIKFGCGNWQYIKRFFPLKTCSQLCLQTQRMFGQQALAEFNKLHLDPKPILDINEKKTDVKRKQGFIVHTGNRLTRSEVKARIIANGKGQVAKEIRDQIRMPVITAEKPTDKEEVAALNTRPRALNKMIHMLKALHKIHDHKPNGWLKKKHEEAIWRRHAEDEAIYAAVVAREAAQPKGAVAMETDATPTPSGPVTPSPPVEKKAAEEGHPIAAPTECVDEAAARPAGYGGEDDEKRPEPAAAVSGPAEAHATPGGENEPIRTTPPTTGDSGAISPSPVEVAAADVGRPPLAEPETDDTQIASFQNEKEAEGSAEAMEVDQTPVQAEHKVKSKKSPAATASKGNAERKRRRPKTNGKSKSGKKRKIASKK